MARKNVSATLDQDLYNKIRIISFKLSLEKKYKININDLIEDGMKLLIERYESKYESNEKNGTD